VKDFLAQEIDGRKTFMPQQHKFL